MFFSWSLPLFRRGCRRALQANIKGPSPYAVHTSVLGAQTCLARSSHAHTLGLLHVLLILRRALHMMLRQTLRQALHAQTCLACPLCTYPLDVEASLAHAAASVLATFSLLTFVLAPVFFLGACLHGPFWCFWSHDETFFLLLGWRPP